MDLRRMDEANRVLEYVYLNMNYDGSYYLNRFEPDTMLIKMTSYNSYINVIEVYSIDSIIVDKTINKTYFTI